jgi:hypothetical protein
MMDASGFMLSGAVICLAFELWERGDDEPRLQP